MDGGCVMPTSNCPSAGSAGSAAGTASQPPDDDEAVCRVCRSPASEDAPLLRPCRCTGSIGNCHADCLAEWLNHSKQDRCELCGFKFQYSKVYQPGAPTSLNAYELASGLAKHLLTYLGREDSTLRYLIAVLMWLTVLPNQLAYVWQILFTDLSFHPDRRVDMLLRLCFGWLIQAFCMLLFGGMLFLRDYIASLPESDNVYFRPGVRRPPGPVPAPAPAAPLDPAADRPGAGGAAAGAEAGLAAPAGAEPRVVPLPRVADAALDEEREAPGPGPAELHAAGAAVDPAPGGLGAADAGDAVDPDDPDAPAMDIDAVLGLRGPWPQLLQSLLCVDVLAVILVSLFCHVSHVAGAAVLSLGASLSAGAPAVAHLFLWQFPAVLENSFFASGVFHAGISTVGLIAMAGAFYCLAALGGRLGFEGSSAYRWAVFLYNFIKVGLLTVMDFGFFPLFAGVLVDVCSLQLFGASIGHRLEFAAHYPFSAVVSHWWLGLLYLYSFSSFVSALREVVHAHVLWALRNPNDPDFHVVREMMVWPVHRHARRILVSFCLYGVLIFGFVYAPIRLCRAVFDASVMSTHIPSPEVFLPVELLVAHACIPTLLDNTGLRAAFVHAIDRWVRAVGRPLKLLRYLVPHPELRAAKRLIRPFEVAGAAADSDADDGGDIPAGGDRPRPNGPAAAPAAGAPVGRAARASEIARLAPRPALFGVRCAVLLFAAWATVVSTMVLFLSGAIQLGRVILRGVGLQERNDRVAVVLGTTALLITAQCAPRLVERISRARLRSGVERIPYWFSVACLCVLGGLCLPYAVGLLAELVIVLPLCVPADQTPTLGTHVSYWILGLLALEIATQNGRAVFSAVAPRGIGDVDFQSARRLIVLPLLLISAVIVLPYVACAGIRSLGVVPIRASMMLRYSYPSLAGLSALVPLVRMAVSWAAAIHCAIRDERYLAGRHLRNYGEDDIATS